MIDLHVHSNKSDGTFSPTELVQYSVEKGLTAIALTDHDTTEGLAEAINAAAGLSLTVIPGIEFSTVYDNKDVHVLGLFIDYDSPVFQEALKGFVNSRILRNEKMCHRLQEKGIDITYEKLLEAYPEAVITRAHYARFMLEQGVIKSMPEAFERYIGDHAPCYVPREKITPYQAVELIRKVKGIPVLAHPPLYRMSDERLEQLVISLKEAGLAGIETIYSTYTRGEENHMRTLAGKYDLLITGGSDFHGSNKPDIDLGTGKGNLSVPEDILTPLYDWLNKQYGV